MTWIDVRIIDGDTVQFKSKDEHWQKEKDGIKPNTVRYIDMMEWGVYSAHDIQYISIVHAESGHTFHRKITDMTCATVGKQPIFIFSWDHARFVQKDSITCLKNPSIMRDVNNIIA